MNEIKETLAVLKKHWPISAVIIGLSFLPNLLSHALRGYVTQFGHLTWFAYLLIAIVAIIITAGFLRSIHLEPNTRKSFLGLLQTGKSFFWRLFGIRILLGLPIMFFLILISRYAGQTNWLIHHQTGTTLIGLLLSKLTLLLPAIIIVADCGFSESFRIMWKIKLLKAKPLLAVFLIQIIVLPYLPYLFPILRASVPAVSLDYALSVLFSLIQHILKLTILLMAVRFISSVGIECNKSYQRPESFELNDIA